MTDSVTDRTILIVEDNRALLKTLSEWFSLHNRVTAVDTLEKAKRAAGQFFDAVVLDVVLPDGNGLDLIPLLPDKTPVVILSDLGEDDNILDGFDAGACDYVVKPCSPKILEKRISLRLLPEQQAVLTKRGLSVDTRTRTAQFNDAPVPLTSSEFNILFFLMQNAGTFFTTGEIYEQVWQMPYLNSGTIRYHLHNLRKKMTDVSDACGALIVTEFGRGYAFAGDIQP